MTCDTIDSVPASVVAEELIASIPDGAPPEPAAPVPAFGIEVNGKSESRVLFFNPDGEPAEMVLSFNPRYLLEYLALCDRKEVIRLETDGPGEPVILKGEHTPATYLVMPLTS